MFRSQHYKTKHYHNHDKKNNKKKKSNVSCWIVSLSRLVASLSILPITTPPGNCGGGGGGGAIVGIVRNSLPPFLPTALVLAFNVAAAASTSTSTTIMRNFSTTTRTQPLAFVRNGIVNPSHSRVVQQKYQHQQQHYCSSPRPFLPRTTTTTATTTTTTTTASSSTRRRTEMFLTRTTTTTATIFKRTTSTLSTSTSTSTLTSTTQLYHAKPKQGSIVDSYRSVSVNCAKCRQQLFRYKKKNGTKSNLVKCYIERISEDSVGLLKEFYQTQQQQQQNNNNNNNSDNYDYNYDGNYNGDDKNDNDDDDDNDNDNTIDDDSSFEWKCPNCQTNFARYRIIHGRPALKLVGGKIRMTKK